MKKVVSLFVVCAMLLSLCTSMTFVANAADKTIDDYMTSILSTAFDTDAEGWSNMTYDADGKMIALKTGTNTNRNWPDGSVQNLTI